MKTVGVVTDSHSSIHPQEAERLGIFMLPMPFFIDGQCYYEGTTLSRAQFFQALKSGAQVSTSQPTPAELTALWDRALAQYDEIVYIPISSGLSGSCERAMLLAREEPYQGRVFVVDNGRVSAPQHRSVLDALELAQQGCSAAQIRDILDENRTRFQVYIAMDTLEFLKRGGRISGAAAAVGGLLNIKPVLQLTVGLLQTYKKCRGFTQAKKATLEAMKQALETEFKAEYEAGDIYLLAASSAPEEVTAQWVEEIRAYFPGLDILSDPLSLGVCCHIGPDALGIGCSCKVKAPGR